MLLAWLCITSVAFQAYAQKNTTFLGHLSYGDESLSGIWGYTAPDGREYALVGATDRFSVVDVTNPASPVEVGVVPGNYSFWREIRTFGEYAYGVDDEAGNGMAIIDLHDLPNSISYTYWHGNNGMNFNRSHTIEIDEFGYAYLLGSNFAESHGGAVILDLNANPTNPPIVGMWTERYIHDGFVRDNILWASEVYDGIVEAIDVSDKNNPYVIGSVTTPDQFAHNCWLSDDSRTLFVTEEVSNASITSYDVTDISDIKLLDRVWHQPGTNAIPHNTYVHGNYITTSYYTHGFTIHDITHPASIIEVGYYDTSADYDGNGFNGAWGIYPYLASKNILVSDIETGLYVIAPYYSPACFLKGNVTDVATNQPLNDVSVKILDPSYIEDVRTDFSGNYITGIADANFYTIQVNKIGYAPKLIENVLLNNGEETLLNVQLTPLQPFTFNGRVVEAVTQQAIAGANVHIFNQEYETTLTADNNGNFAIPAFFAGNYTIIVGKWGYQTQGWDNQTFSQQNNNINIELPLGYYDDFSFDYGWTAEGETPTGGVWERVVPVGTTFQGPQFTLNPYNDIDTDFGNTCFVTGNNGLYDFVNDGSVTLTSPYFDLTAYGEAHLSFYTWFRNIGFGSVNDKMYIYLSNGTTEVLLKTITVSGNNDLNWHLQSFKVEDYIPISNQMQLRVVAEADFNDQEALDCGFDGFTITDATGAIAVQNPTNNAANTAQILPNLVAQGQPVQLVLKEVPTAPLSLVVVDLSGKAYAMPSIAQQNTTITTTAMPAGMYFYQLLDAKGTSLAGGKFIVR